MGIKKSTSIFHTAGRGNIYNNKRNRKWATYTVYSKNTGDKWKNKHRSLTDNQANTLGLIAALVIIEDKHINNVSVCTSNRVVFKWAKGDWEPTKEWSLDLVKRLRNEMRKIHNIQIIKIDKQRNLAYGI